MRNGTGRRRVVVDGEGAGVQPLAVGVVEVRDTMTLIGYIKGGIGPWRWCVYGKVIEAAMISFSNIFLESQNFESYLVVDG